MFHSSQLRKRAPTLYGFDRNQRIYLEFKVAKSCVMSPIAVKRLQTRTNRTRIGVAHHVTGLIFYNVTRCYGKHVAVLAVAVATCDIIKYQSFVYRCFVWGIHVRYNKIQYQFQITSVAEYRFNFQRTLHNQLGQCIPGHLALCVFVFANVPFKLALCINGAPRGFGDLGRMTIYFQGSREHW